MDSGRRRTRSSPARAARSRGRNTRMSATRCSTGRVCPPAMDSTWGRYGRLPRLATAACACTRTLRGNSTSSCTSVRRCILPRRNPRIDAGQDPPRPQDYNDPDPPKPFLTSPAVFKADETQYLRRKPTEHAHPTLSRPGQPAHPGCDVPSAGRSRKATTAASSWRRSAAAAA